MKYDIQFKNLFSQWRHYQTKTHLPDAIRVAANRASSTGKQHRVIDEDGQLIDLLYP